MMYLLFRLMLFFIIVSVGVVFASVALIFLALLSGAFLFIFLLW